LFEPQAGFYLECISEKKRILIKKIIYSMTIVVVKAKGM
jgi:hypothetical protein